MINSSILGPADLAAARARMVERQIAARGLRDPRLLEAMRTVPREQFVPEHLVGMAFEDGPLPIEGHQTISQPYIVALMIDAAAIGADDHVLEVGAGSGYAAAVMGRMAKSVVAVERLPELARLAAARMQRLGYANVKVIEGDGTMGVAEEAPFDAILAAASGPFVPDALLRQLRIGGRLVMPVGRPHGNQHLVKVTRRGEADYARENLGAVRFVPLIGAFGFDG